MKGKPHTFLFEINMETLDGSVISGLSSGQIMQYDGTNWVNTTPTLAAPGGSAGNVQLNDGTGGFAGSNDFDFTLNVLTVNGAVNITGQVDDIQLYVEKFPGQSAKIVEVQDDLNNSLLTLNNLGYLGLNQGTPTALLHLYIDSTFGGIFIEENFGSLSSSAIPFKYGTSGNTLFEIDKFSNVTIEPAPGAGSKNRGVHIDAGNWSISNSYSSDNLGLMAIEAIATGTAAKDFAAFEGILTVSATVGSGKVGHGARFLVKNTSAVTSAALIGGKFDIDQSGAGNITNLFGGWFRFDGGGAGTVASLRLANYGAGISSTPVTNGYGGYYEDWSKSSGTIGTLNGIYLEEMTAGTTNWQIYSVAGSHYLGGDLQVVGALTTDAGRIRKENRVTTTYTILVTDDVVFGDTDLGSFTVTLPPGVAGQTFKVENSGDSGNLLTVDPDGLELLIRKNSGFDLNDGESLDVTYNTTNGWG